MDKAVLFYDAHRWLKGDPCFDVRYDAQAIPAGMVVCGMIVGDRQLFAPPAMSESQSLDLDAVIVRAQFVLAHGYDPGVDDAIVMMTPNGHTCSIAVPRGNGDFVVYLSAEKSEYNGVGYYGISGMSGYRRTNSTTIREFYDNPKAKDGIEAIVTAWQLRSTESE